MRLLADANWLIRLEREILRRKIGPAARLFESQRIHVNTVSLAEFLSRGVTPLRARILGATVQLAPISYRHATKAAQLRYRQSRAGRSLSLPDALMAASAIGNRMRLLTADKDFSGIPGLDWSAYRT